MSVILAAMLASKGYTYDPLVHTFGAPAVSYTSSCGLRDRDCLFRFVNGQEYREWNPAEAALTTTRGAETDSIPVYSTSVGGGKHIGRTVVFDSGPK